MLYIEPEFVVSFHFQQTKCQWLNKDYNMTKSVQEETGTVDMVQYHDTDFMPSWLHEELRYLMAPINGTDANAFNLHEKLPCLLAPVSSKI